MSYQVSELQQYVSLLNKHSTTHEIEVCLYNWLNFVFVNFYKFEPIFNY